MFQIGQYVFQMLPGTRLVIREGKIRDIFSDGYGNELARICNPEEEFVVPISNLLAKK